VTFPNGIELRPFVKDEHAVAVWEADNEASAIIGEATTQPLRIGRTANLTSPVLTIPVDDRLGWQPDRRLFTEPFPQGESAGSAHWESAALAQNWAGACPASTLVWRILQTRHDHHRPRCGCLQPTGATRLYQRAGMYVASEFATYEKELRPGRSLE